MRKNVKIWENRLEISKEGEFYMINDAKADLFIHADKLEFGQTSIDRVKGWLILKHKDVYIGSLWINTDTDMKKVEQFLEETK